MPGSLGKRLGAQQVLMAPGALACRAPEQLLARRPGGCDETLLFLLVPFVQRQKFPGNIAVKALQ